MRPLKRHYEIPSSVRVLNSRLQKIPDDAFSHLHSPARSLRSAPCFTKCKGWLCLQLTYARSFRALLNYD